MKGVLPTRPPVLRVRAGQEAWVPHRSWWLSARAFARKYYRVPASMDAADILPTPVQSGRAQLT